VLTVNFQIRPVQVSELSSREAGQGKVLEESWAKTAAPGIGILGID
jgi:hypothetical protein